MLHLQYRILFFVFLVSNGIAVLTELAFICFIDLLIDIKDEIQEIIINPKIINSETKIYDLSFSTTTLNDDDKDYIKSIYEFKGK